MRSCLKSEVTFLALALAIAGPAAAQTTEAKPASSVPYFRDLPAWDPNYKPPRTPDGKPDLQGVWSSASLTMMSRAGGRDGSSGVNTLIIPESIVEEITRNAFYNTVKESEKQATPADAPAGNPDGTKEIRGYNAYWIDPGAEFGRINGEYRSSWITVPENGSIPFSQAGREKRASRMAAFRNNPNTGYEVRSVGDRCLISYISQAGPPLTNGMYNNHYQIVQTSEHIMLNTEMNHDARIISLNHTPRPDAVTQWFGDSVGKWEGDTLVVTTKNFAPAQESGAYIPVSSQGTVTERFSRVSDSEIFYEFTVDDPVYYSQSWKGEMPLRKSTDHIYEYACHEGNYALPGMLAGMVRDLDTAIEADGE